MRKLPVSTGNRIFTRFDVVKCFVMSGCSLAVCNWLCPLAECYAVMPPLERFLEVPREERRELFFRDIERGDIVIGRITSIREFGFFMVLICLGSGVIREIADLEITVRYSFGQ